MVSAEEKGAGERKGVKVGGVGVDGQVFGVGRERELTGGRVRIVGHRGMSASAASERCRE